MPSDFLFRSVTPVSDTWTSGSKNRRHPISARLLAPAQTYSVGTGILHSPRYPRTDANLPRCVRTGILTRIHYPRTDANPPHRVGTDILPTHPLSPYRRKPHQKRRYGHTHSRRVFPYRRKTVFRVGMGIPAYLHYPHTDANPPLCVRIGILTRLHYPHTDAKAHRPARETPNLSSRKNEHGIQQ